MKKQLLATAVAVAVGLSLTAAAITHTILQSYQTSSGSLTGTAAVTSDTEQNADVALSGSNAVLAVSLNVTTAQSLCFYATTPVTVTCYYGATLWNTISLTNYSPLVAIGSNQIWAVLATNQCTSLHLNPGTNSGTFSMRSIVHNGP